MALAQQPGYMPVRVPAKQPINSNQRTLNPLAVEICNNGIDDDGNGLADLKDYSCYYDRVANDKCEVSKIVWGCSGSDLYWADIETGEIRYAGNMNNINTLDMCWGSDGNLYVVGDFSTIWRVDPNTLAVTYILQLNAYAGTNALVGGEDGMLYFSSIGDQINGIVGKIDLATLAITEIARLTNARPSGDLTFINGMLYVICSGYQMAVINPGSGAVTMYPVKNLPEEMTMGMLTLGDGYLYVSAIDKVYKLNPLTMTVMPTPVVDFNNPLINFTGLSNYSEICNAPACKATLDISVSTPSPFCSATGAALKGDGQGIRGEAVYEWTLPDQSVVKSINHTAMTTGMYKLSYYGVTDFCGDKDSVYIEVLQSPSVWLGNDTLICRNSSAELIPGVGAAINSYTWQDGSTDTKYTAVRAGIYWVQVANSCGVARDTIIVNETGFPEVQLDMNTAICPGSSLNVFNKKQKQTWDDYIWSNGSKGESITIQSAGTYWLQNANVCGATRDSIIVSYIDSCTCFPLYPRVALGNDLLICSYETVALKNPLHESGFRYNWQNGSTDKNIIAKAPGTYWVDVSTYCGTVRDSILIIEKKEGCERKVMVPAAFTPNGDGRNDLFRPVVYGVPDQYEFIVYNRWGQIVFRSKKPAEGWNGVMNGKKQDSNIYVWTCTYQFSGEALQMKKGSVALIK